jgi:excisionase family DNA binding protein
MAAISSRPEQDRVSQSTMAKRSQLECATYTLAEFARLMGVSYTNAHERAQAGSLPVKPIVGMGRRYRFPKATVHRLLCIEAEEPTTDD